MSEAWRQPTDTVRHMKVHVRLFAAIRERAGAGAVEVELADGATVGDVWAALDLGSSPPGSSTRVIGRTSIEPSRSSPGTRSRSSRRSPAATSGSRPILCRVDAAVAEVRDDTAGAIATFIGATRARSRGRDVLHLEYEAYEGMAEQVMADLAAQLLDRHELCRVAIHHRVGRVDIGETSVVIAVSAPHRAAALAACAEAIDELKVSVPLWKKETYVGGEEWIGQGS